jgi:hypothetical protein
MQGKSNTCVRCVFVRVVGFVSDVDVGAVSRVVPVVMLVMGKREEVGEEDHDS